MKTYHQRRCYKHIVMASSIALLITIASIVYGLIVVVNKGQFANNVFEIIYMAAHTLIITFILVISVEAIRKKPFILKELTLTKEGDKDKTYPIIGLILAIIGLIGVVMGVLMTFNVIATTFPIFLNLDIANAGLTLIIVGLSLFLFPISYRKDNMSEILAKY